MPEIKIILAERPWNFRNKYAEYIFDNSITDWELISDREYQDLVDNLKYLPEPPYNRVYQLIVKDTFSAGERLSSLQEGIKQRKAEAEEKQRIKEENTKKRKETEKKKKEREEKKMLEELKAKYGS